jgi:glucose/arabinose dehydrogenase
MKCTILFFILFNITYSVQSQTFTRSELSTPISKPWEIFYGPDDYLWLTESGGNVSRVNPLNGDKTVIYTAPDYYAGSPLENSTLCPNYAIGSGTLGLALHPDFLETENSFIYFVYSYNSGTLSSPNTKFRIKRLTWNSANQTVVSDTNIVNMISNGYDHFGGRLMAIKQNNTAYLFLTIGDHGKSEDSSPECYSPQSTNPNNFTQDITTQQGKIHRFNEDGTIPIDNPIGGNSFYTRGHRNPQGLMYNPNLDLIYDIEHGDRTDDEINILQKGMNYGWKTVRGFHDDESYSGEANRVANYTPHPLISNDALIEPLFSWCNTPSTSNQWSDWCTVAPSDGVYYGSNGIPQWNNSLLVVTLKDGLTTDKEVYQFKLEADGQLATSTALNPNPKRFFGEDQELNGRLRDITFSNDGKTIYLINNGGATDKITVYTVDKSVIPTIDNLEIFPNPVSDILSIKALDLYSNLTAVRIYTLIGSSVKFELDSDHKIDVSHLSNGVYFIYLTFKNQTHTFKFIKN